MPAESRAEASWTLRALGNHGQIALFDSSDSGRTTPFQSSLQHVRVRVSIGSRRYDEKVSIPTAIQMRSLTCDLCEFVAQGETFEDWMKALMPHYMEAHADVMNDPKNGEEERESWMAENRARFDAA